MSDEWTNEDHARQARANREDAFARIFWPVALGVFFGGMAVFIVIGWLLR